MKRFIVLVLLFSFAFIPSTNADEVIWPGEWRPGDQLMLYLDLFSGDSIQGSHIDFCLQGGPGEDDQCSQIGMMGLLDIEDDNTWRWYGGYCIEADVGAAAVEGGILYGEQGAIDGRIQWLTWHFDTAYAVANGNTKYLEFAAVQALVWGLVR